MDFSYASALLGGGDWRRLREYIDSLRDHSKPLSLRHKHWLIKKATDCGAPLDTLEQFLGDYPELQTQRLLRRAGFSEPDYSTEVFETKILCKGHEHPRHIDELFQKKGHPGNFKLSGSRSPDVSLLTFRRVFLHVTAFGFAIFDHKGNPFNFSSLPLIERNIQWFNNIPNRTSIDDLFFDGSSRPIHANNYCLWFTDHLSRICWSEKVQPQVAVGIPLPALNAFQRDSLAHLNLPRGYTLLSPGIYPVKRLSMVSSSDHTGLSRLQCGNPEFAKPLIERFASRRKAQSDMIFIDRRPGSRRALSNREEVHSAVRDAGFQIVDPGEHSLRDQINIFSAAYRIVGLHGAGLTNILFAPSETSVLEIFPPHYGTRAFSWIAHCKNQNYSIHFADDAKNIQNPMEDGTLINIADFKASLSNFVGRQ